MKKHLKDSCSLIFFALFFFLGFSNFVNASTLEATHSGTGGSGITAYAYDFVGTGQHGTATTRGISITSGTSWNIYTFATLGNYSNNGGTTTGVSFDAMIVRKSDKVIMGRSTAINASDLCNSSCYTYWQFPSGVSLANSTLYYFAIGGAVGNSASSNTQLYYFDATASSSYNGLEWFNGSSFGSDPGNGGIFNLYGDSTYIPPSCSDGIQNQDETAVDFGGICPQTETISSNIVSSTTWDRGHLYLVSGNIEITSGHTLTIGPGTIVKFDTSTSSSLTVNGMIVAEGDMGDEHSLGKIFFTSSKDDSLLGLDTNNDGNSTSPSSGDWGGIIIGSGGTATFNKAIIRYAGKTGTSEAQIYNDGGTLTVENSDVVYGTTYGIYSNSGTTILTSSELGFNNYGLYKNGGTVTFDFDLDGNPNIIHDNSLYGVYNNTVSSIDAEHNYWGDSSGPYHSTNTGGLGNPVSDYVDFDPWNNNKHYISSELRSGCADFNNCTSIYDNELRWKNVDVSSYTTELSSSLSTWDALENVSLIEDNSTPALEFHQVNMDDIAWKGQWDPTQSPDFINLNSYYLDNDTSDQIQNTITHEIGHALGLDHSYTGNVMYFNQTSQTTLGLQDLSDYYYLWP